jgi:CheY-like chemotaxis protein
MTKRQQRVLVAEDDDQQLGLIAMALSERGVDVTPAHSGEELVLRLVDRGPFDLVITDIFMPWMDGLQAMRSIRHAGVKVPIVFITGSADPALQDHVASFEGDAVLLPKPVDLTELESVVDQLLGNGDTHPPSI